MFAASLGRADGELDRGRQVVPDILEADRFGNASARRRLELPATFFASI